MPTYYHGTPSRNEKSIERHGICPPRTCPVGAKQNWVCDEEAVFVSDTPAKAAYFAHLAARSQGIAHQKVLIYKLEGKSCHVEGDNWGRIDVGGGTFRLKGCGCIRPAQKCQITGEEASRIYLGWKRWLDEDIGGTSVPEPDLVCKWKKIN